MIREKILLAIILFLSVNAEKQLLATAESPVPFSTITIKINVSVNSNQNTFHEFWNPEVGGELIIEMPFYLGDIQAGIHLYPYSGLSAYQPDFISLNIFIGWGFGLKLSPRIRWYGGLRVGNYQMYFDDSDIHESQALESELCAGLNTRLEYNLINSWSLQIGATFLHVYTKKPLELIMITTGFSYTFDAPAWLREFLK